MSTNFILTLDTTAPDAAIELAAGVAYVGTQDITAVVTSAAPDATFMKLWGDVDAAFDPNVQPTEGASAWIGFSHAAKAIRLAAGDGLKAVFVKVMDDVGNVLVAPASDTITLDATAPVITITVDFAPTKISKVHGPPTVYDESAGVFSSDSDLQAWEVRVVPTGASGRGTGAVIPAAGGSTNTSGGAKAAGVGVAVMIRGADLEAASPGDGDKVVKIFGQDASGTWSA